VFQALKEFGIEVFHDCIIIRILNPDPDRNSNANKKPQTASSANLEGISSCLPLTDDVRTYPTTAIKSIG
jgi:hypothetical protein